MKIMARATLITAGLSLFFLGLLACKKEPPWRRREFATRDLSRSTNDVELPQKLWDLISDTDGEERTSAPVGVEALTEFVPVTVYLIEKNRGILRGGDLKLQYGPGGGELDLHDYVQEKNGSFRVAMEFMPELAGERRIYFLSNSVVRERDRAVLGSGCDTYFDISGAFAREMKEDGFLVNTTDGRHVSALAGTYFFAMKHAGKLRLAQLTIRDSARRVLQCRR